MNERQVKKHLTCKPVYPQIRLTLYQSMLNEAYEAYTSGQISCDEYLDTLCDICDLDKEDE